MNRNIILNALIDAGPAFAFYISAQFVDFYTASGILLFTTVLSVIAGLTLSQRLPILPLLASTFVIIGSTITLLFSAPDAVIFSTTAYEIAFGLILLIGIWRKRDSLKFMFGTLFAVTDAGWRILSYRWLGYSILAALSNEYVRLTMEPDAWVDFKFYLVIFTSVFGLYQFTVTRQYRIPEEANNWGFRIHSKQS